MDVRGLRRPALRRIPTDLVDALWLLLVMRVALGLLALFIGSRVALPGPCHFELALDGWETVPPLAAEDPGFHLVGVWQRWDACWYSKVATFGYEANEPSANFWPLLPTAMRLVAAPLGGNVALAGLIVVAIAYLLAAVGLRRLVRRDLGDAVAERTVRFVTIAPAGLFLFAPFTEAPFLAASVWALLAARERRWGLAAIAGLLAALTRIQGVFLLLPIGWEALAVLRAARDGGARGRVGPLLATVAPALGFGSFLLFTQVALGRTPLDTQALWGGKDFHPPWEVVAASLAWIVERGDGLQALNLATLLGAIALVSAGIRRLPASYSLLALPQVALIAIRIQPTPLTSTTRLLEVVFPLFVVIALAAEDPRLRSAWTLLSTLALGALTWLFVTGDWVA